MCTCLFRHITQLPHVTYHGAHACRRTKSNTSRCTPALDPPKSTCPTTTSQAASATSLVGSKQRPTCAGQRATCAGRRFACACQQLACTPVTLSSSSRENLCLAAMQCSMQTCRAWHTWHCLQVPALHAMPAHCRVTDQQSCSSFPAWPTIRLLCMTAMTLRHQRVHIFAFLDPPHSVPYPQTCSFAPPILPLTAPAPQT